MGEKELRVWAMERFRAFGEALAAGRADDATRRVVHAYVAKIEIDSHGKTGVLYLPADATPVLAGEASNRVAHGDPSVPPVRKRTGWRNLPRTFRAMGAFPLLLMLPWRGGVGACEVNQLETFRATNWKRSGTARCDVDKIDINWKRSAKSVRYQ